MTQPKRNSPAKLAAGLAISALLALGTFAAPANAEWNGHHRADHHGGYGGYYRAPPVVYGPGVGIGLPGINIGIR